MERSGCHYPYTLYTITCLEIKLQICDKCLYVYDTYDKCMYVYEYVWRVVTATPLHVCLYEGMHLCMYVRLYIRICMERSSGCHSSPLILIWMEIKLRRYVHMYIRVCMERSRGCHSARIISSEWKTGAEIRLSYIWYRRGCLQPLLYLCQ